MRQFVEENFGLIRWRWRVLLVLLLPVAIGSIGLQQTAGCRKAEGLLRPRHID